MDKKIEAVMESFDFENVHRAMKAVGWTWYLKDVPSLYQIITSAKDKLERVSKEDGERHIESGGFRAGKDEDGELYLEFIMSGVYSGDL